MDTSRIKSVSEQDYIRNVMRGRQARDGIGISKLMQESGSLAADFIRQGLVLIGILGLIFIAVGVSTGGKIYQDMFSWINSLHG